MTLSITTSTLAGDVVEVSPNGEIDVENAYEIREAVAGLLGLFGNPQPFGTVEVAAGA